jgi:hypothetical protein
MKCAAGQASLQGEKCVKKGHCVVSAWLPKFPGGQLSRQSQESLYLVENTVDTYMGGCNKALAIPNTVVPLPKNVS